LGALFKQEKIAIQRKGFSFQSGLVSIASKKISFVSQNTFLK
jgi:hypothetical protein